MLALLVSRITELSTVCQEKHSLWTFFEKKNNLKICLGQHPCLSDLRHLATIGAQM